MDAAGVKDAPVLPADASPEDVERERQRVESIEQGLVAAGEATHEPAPVDYFDFDDTETVPLPDGVQWFEIKSLNEGERKRYLNQTNSNVGVSRATGDMNIRTKPGDDKHLLLSMAIVNFHIVKQGQQVKWSEQNLRDVLDKFPPTIIDIVEKAVRMKNPWLLGDVALEDMIKERDNLNDLIEKKQQEEAGKGS